jgi:hypothetical protein
VDGNLLHVDLAAVLCGDGDGGLGALCEDDGPGPLCVLLGAVGDNLGDLLDVLGVDVVRLGEGSGLSLVADKDVDVGEDLVKRVLEELCDERSGQVKDEGLDSVSYHLLLAKVRLTLFLAAASSARALMAGTQTVKWKPPT